jgi:MFS family permease
MPNSDELKIPAKKTLNPTVIRLGIVSFFTDIAGEMLYPVTPIFLTSILGASMSSLGLIEGIAEALASFLKTYSGSWSDSLSKRKPFIWFGYALSALSKPLIGISQTWIGVLIARSLDRTGKGIRSAPRDALLADSVESVHRGAAFGWHRGMDTLGAVIGPLLAVLLLSLNSQDLRSLYFWALIPGIISVLVIFLVKESPSEARTKKVTTLENPLKMWRQFDPAFRKYMCAWGVFSLTNSSDVFLLLKCKDFGFSTQSVIFLYCFFNLVYSLSSPYLGKLSDRIDRRKVLTAGLILFFFVYLGFSMATKSWHFWSLFAIYGLYMGATEGVGKALAVDLSPQGLKATGIGILGTVTGVCTLLASFSAGLIWDYWGAPWTFIFGALGAFVAAFIMKFL